MRFDKPILLYGAGREALSTRNFLTENYPDTPVFVTSDDGTATLEGCTAILPDALASAFAADTFGLIAKSPGVSLYKPIFDLAREAKIPITSNLNIWAEHFQKGRRIIAITGTKGKSTTATLVHLMLEHSGIANALAGNVGVAPLDIRDHAQTIVFELSSYQTADINFAADIVGLTNLFPEHVDWHGNVATYYADKLNLLMRAEGRPVAIGKQAEKLLSQAGRLALPITPISHLGVEAENTVHTAARGSKLKGAHNVENALLAARLSLAAGATIEGIQKGIAAFEPLPHRLEEHVFGKLICVDDSISTTPQATLAALNAYKGQKIALIAGGHEREQDYTELAQSMTDLGVSTLVCLPTTGQRLAESARKYAPEVATFEVQNLSEAMMLLGQMRASFGTLILSPGAPSYNQFKNFEERGRAFIALCEKLPAA